jgi:glycosyltransferase involved in cell wall biosynthesis
VKVLVVSSYGGLGGAELALTAFLAERPQDVDVRAFLVDDGPLRARLEQLGIDVAAGAGYAGRPTPVRTLRFGRELWRLLGESRPNVVWALGQKAALLTAAPARARRVPLVWHKVDFSWDRTLGMPLAAAANGVIAVSNAVADAIGPLRKRRLLGVVGPPVRLPASLRARPDPGRPVIGTLARLVPYKGHRHLIGATALLAGEFPELRLVLAGEEAPQYPGYRESLERLAAELGISERVELPGFVEPAAVLERLSVFVNATYRDEQGFGLEGLSGAMLEASWAGVPVVATAGGGTAEGVVDGETGTLVSRPEPEALAAAIAPYLRDPALAERTANAGMDFARARFAPTVLSAELFSLLSRAARSRGREETKAWR